MTCCDKTPYSGGYVVPPFWGFTNYAPSVPKMYWQVRSQEQRILNLFELMNKVICYADCLGENVNELIADFEELEEKLSDPEFIEQYIETLQTWIDEHMPEIIGKAAQIVYFGINTDGYFVAYIPEGNAWDDIIFDTGQNYALETYGRLMLYYKTDGSSDVWQPDINQNDWNTVITAIDDLEQRVSTNEDTLYNPLEEGE